jgi:hypothetical protein
VQVGNDTQYAGIVGRSDGLVVGATRAPGVALQATHVEVSDASSRFLIASL